MHDDDVTPKDLIEIVRFYGGEVFVDSPESVAPKMCIQIGEVPDDLLDELFVRGAAVKSELQKEWEETVDDGWDGEDIRAA